MITSGEYKRHNALWWVDKIVISSQPIASYIGELPAGTRFRVTRKYNGFSVVSNPCSCCGMKLSITKVPPHSLTLEGEAHAHS